MEPLSTQMPDAVAEGGRGATDHAHINEVLFSLQHRHANNSHVPDANATK